MLLLRAEPFVFEGATITFSEQRRRPPPEPAEGTTERILSGSSLNLAPRIVRKPGIGKGRQAPAVDKSLSRHLAVSNQDLLGLRDQNDFRAIVEAKNKQRELKRTEAASPGKTETKEKRLAQDVEQSEAKRFKPGG